MNSVILPNKLPIINKAIMGLNGTNNSTCFNLAHQVYHKGYIGAKILVKKINIFSLLEGLRSLVAHAPIYRNNRNEPLPSLHEDSRFCRVKH